MTEMINKEIKFKTGYLRNNYRLYLMLIPAAAFYILFKYGPMYGVLIAFQDYNLFAGVFHSKWVGIQVFQDIMSSKIFWQVLINTLRLNLLCLVAGFPMPILFALMLYEITSEKFKRVVQTISYLPHFISWVIVYGMLVAFVTKDSGLFNAALKSMGLQQINFLTDHGWWLFMYVMTGLWKETGWATILYLSALSSINPSLHEAAAIDGAGRFQRLWHITLPGIRSTIVILLIFNIGRIMSIGFEQPFLMGNAMVMDISNVLSTYIYDNGLIHTQFSFTTAVGLFQSVINFMLLMTADFIARRLGEDGLFGGKK